jgi:hypothetical protein
VDRCFLIPPQIYVKSAFSNSHQEHFTEILTDSS